MTISQMIKINSISLFLYFINILSLIIIPIHPQNQFNSNLGKVERKERGDTCQFMSTHPNFNLLSLWMDLEHYNANKFYKIQEETKRMDFDHL